MVICRKPKTRSAAEGSNPSASAESTTAIWCEGVFRRYNGVSRRALNVVWQARASKGLDALGLTMLAILDESVDVSLGDAKVLTLPVGTGETLGVHPDGGLPAGF